MKNGKNLLFIIFFLILIVYSSLAYAVEKHPIIQKREDFIKSMYQKLCKEDPLSIYCLYSTASTISDAFFYDPYLIEDDFTIPSPALNMQNCVREGGDAGSFICEDNRWLVTGTWDRCGTGSSHISNNKLIIESTGHCGSYVTAKYKVNLKNKDIKFKTTANIISVRFGNKDFQVGSDSHCYEKDDLVEIIKDVTDNNNFVLLINGEVKNEFIIQGDEAYLSFNQQGAGAFCGGSWVSGQDGTIQFIKSKPYFSCETDNNEVWISDSFGEGSTFDIHSLTYESTKFCPQDYPAVVRDYRQRGVKSDVRGTITEKLTRGLSFTVPTFQSYEIRYATLYKEGMGTRCDINEVYDTKTRTCIPKIFEQDYIIKDCHSEGCEEGAICRDNGVCEKYTEIIINKNCLQLGCPIDYECLPEGYCVKTLIQQIRPTCADITCDVAYGEYCEMRGDFPVCVRPYKVIEVIRDTEFITIGKNQKLFKNNLIIGDTQITSGTPRFTCGGNENQHSPLPRPDCWKTDVSFRGNTYTMNDGDEIDLNEYFKLKVVIDALYHEECDGDSCRMVVKNGAENNFILTIKNFGFIRTEAIKGDKLDYYVIKDSSRELCFKITNNLGATFNSQQAGYSLKKTTDLITMESRTMEEKGLSVGSSNYCIPIDSKRYGELFYQINPYFKLGDEIFFDDEQITYNYKIVDKVPVNETIIYTDVDKYITIERNVTKYITIERNVTIRLPTIPQTKSSFPWVYLIIGFAILLLLYFIFSDRK